MPNDGPDYGAAVINAVGTKITSNRPPVLLGTAFDSPSNPQTTNFVIPTDVQGLVIVLPQALAGYVHLKIAWHPITSPSFYVPLELFEFTQQLYAIPILPSSLDGVSNFTNSIDVTLQGTSLGNVGVQVWALFEPNPLWLQVFPLPQLQPNQFPKTVLLTLAALVAQWIIQSVANVQITLFNIVVMRYNPSVANDDFIIGYSAVLPPNAMAPPNAEILIDSTQTAASGTGPMFTIPLAGVQLPRGSGLWADTSQSAIANLWLLVEYSLG